MCGILGLIRLNSEPVTSEELLSGTARLQHRGPDIHTHWLNASRTAGLAHARLSIIDLSPEGNQPFANETGQIQVVANGEIYNYQSLKPRLQAQGHRFYGGSDCEILPHLYEESGTHLFDQLDGMFAIAIWDEEQRRLILARDPFGKKPLFYHHQKGKLFAFASEIKALLPYLPNREVDRDNLLNYLACGYTLGESTIFKDIDHVPPGGGLIFDFDTETIEFFTFWEWPKTLPAGSCPDSPTEWLDAFRTAFLQAVEKRLMADVPLGAFLSGGVDSSAVVAAMHARAPERERHTFSIHFGEDSYETHDHIDTMVQRYKLQHHRISFTADDFVHWFEPVMASNDGLLADLSLLPMYKLAHEAGKVLRVVLTGDGADELLAGYDTYKATGLALQFGPLRQMSGRVAQTLGNWLPTGTSREKLNPSVVLQQLGHGLSQPVPALIHARWRQIFSEKELGSLLTPEYTKAIFPDSEIYQREWDHVSGDWLLKAQALDVRTWMRHSILPKVDRSTMASSLEARCPFLDKALAELLSSLPVALKQKHPKWLLREAMSSYLPKEVAWQRKSGFNTPISRWILEVPEVRSLARHWLLSEQALSHGVFNRSSVEQLWQKHQTRDYHLKLWNLMVFNAWHANFSMTKTAMPTQATLFTGL
jgi:asparagine synthase (glutamine-hydrolysing)